MSAQGIYRTPPNGVEARLAAAITAAQTGVIVCEYELTSVPLTAALLAAAKRGVRLTIILDAKEAARETSHAKTLKAAGITVLLDSAHAIMHVKLCVVDGKIAIYGSYNWSFAAENENAELSIIDTDPENVAALTQIALDHAAHSTPM